MEQLKDQTSTLSNNLKFSKIMEIMELGWYFPRFESKKGN